jgi:hypothetical protein
MHHIAERGKVIIRMQGGGDYVQRGHAPQTRTAKGEVTMYMYPHLGRKDGARKDGAANGTE